MIIAVLLLASGVSSAMDSNPQPRESKLNRADIIEIVIYTTKPGVSPSEHLKKAMKAGQVLATLDGFIARHFTRDSEGKWVDLVYWRDMESAKKAAEIFPTVPECLDFIDDINESDMQFMHTSILSAITE